MTVSCPETERVKNYRDIQKEWRKRPEYREKSDAWLKKNPWCEVWLEVGIKVPATEIHHPNKWSYQHGFEVYVDFDNNGAMAVSGKARKPKKGNGHYACHHSLKVCPICKERMCDQHAEGCQQCLKTKYPNLAKKLDEDKERKKQERAKVIKDRKEKEKVKRKKIMNKHPCEHHGLERKCKVNRPFLCPHSAKQAEQNCEKFKERIKK